MDSLVRNEKASPQPLRRLTGTPLSLHDFRYRYANAPTLDRFNASLARLHTYTPFHSLAISLGRHAESFS
jgi:hypothetical protein